MPSTCTETSSILGSSRRKKKNHLGKTDDRPMVSIDHQFKIILKTNESAEFNINGVFRKKKWPLNIEFWFVN